MSDPMQLVQVICGECGSAHLVEEAVLVDGEAEQSCPACRGIPVPQATPLRSELQRLYEIELAAREWHRAHQATEAEQAGQFRKERLLPVGSGAALRKLAALLADDA
jgi:hypothetical protein